ncbi:MAG: hypothetical protein AAB518_02540 [Patescibacteria group bacterium]
MKNSEHESPLRKLFSKAHNQKFEPLEGFDEAKKYDDGYLIMEGDDGGQIYLSIPAKLITIPEVNCQKLLEAIDGAIWGDLEMARICYERIEINQGIVGGMGGGMATSSLWLHNNLEVARKEINLFLRNVLPEKEARETLGKIKEKIINFDKKRRVLPLP